MDMKKTKLWATFISLGKWECNELERVVNSPIFNQRADVKRLFDVLAELRFSSKKKSDFSKEAIYKRVFDSSDFDDQQLRLVQSLLLKCIEEVFLLQFHRKNEANRTLILADAYKSRGLHKYFTSELQEGQRILEKQNIRNNEYHQLCYNFRLNEYRSYLDEHSWSANGCNMNVQLLSNELDYAFFAQKIRSLCLLNEYNKNVNVKQVVPMLTWEVLDFVKRENLIEKIPAIGIYYYCFKMQKNNSEFDYKCLKKLFVSASLSFQEVERNELCCMAFQFTFNKWLTDAQYYEEVVFWLEVANELRLLEQDGYLGLSNLTKSFCLAKKYKECEALFVMYEETGVKLEEAFYVLIASKALYHFHKKEKEACIELLTEFAEQESIELSELQLLLICQYDLGLSKEIPKNQRRYMLMAEQLNNLPYDKSFLVAFNYLMKDNQWLKLQEYLIKHENLSHRYWFQQQLVTQKSSSLSLL